MKIFKLPDLGEGLQEAELVEWRVRPGDEVVVDAPLLAVETAKAAVEIPSPYAGRVARLFANIGDIVHIGAPLVGFEGQGAEDQDFWVGRWRSRIWNPRACRDGSYGWSRRRESPGDAGCPRSRS